MAKFTREKDKKHQQNRKKLATQYSIDFCLLVSQLLETQWFCEVQQSTEHKTAGKVICKLLYIPKTSGKGEH